MLAGVAAGAHATTIVPMTPRTLVASALGAVRGRVTAIESARDPASGGILTQITIDPAERVFGSLPAGPVVLHELGGVADGIEQRVFGAPQYRIGDAVLVFVSEDRSGILHTTGLAMGVYHIDESGGRAARSFGGGVAVLDRTTGTLTDGDAEGAVDLPDLLRTVRDVARSRFSADAPAPRTPATPVRVPLQPRTAFTFFNPAVRWFEADDGDPVRYLIDATGDTTIGASATREAVDAGLAVWSAVATAHLTLEDGGDTEPAPLGGCPDGTRIVFNDPFGEIDAPTQCEGVLAITLICDGDEVRVVNGKSFRRIFSAKTTLNDGFGTCPFWNPCSVGEILTHELGHTVGLGHSQFASATMAARAHFDGRCASLTLDDENGLAAIYPLPPSVSPTPSVTPSPVATATVTVTAPSATPTLSATPTSSSTATATSTRTRTATRTLTPSNTVRPSRTATATWTRVPSRTMTVTSTATASVTPTPSRTTSASATASSSPTAAATTSATTSTTRSQSPTSSSSPLPSSSPTVAPSVTLTASATAATGTPLATATGTTTPDTMPTATPTRPATWLLPLVNAIRRFLALLANST